MQFCQRFKMNPARGLVDPLVIPIDNADSRRPDARARKMQVKRRIHRTLESKCDRNFQGQDSEQRGGNVKGPCSAGDCMQ